jgi:ribosomal protein S6
VIGWGDKGGCIVGVEGSCEVGEMIECDDMGSRELAYEIDKNKRGSTL